MRLIIPFHLLVLAVTLSLLDVVLAAANGCDNFFLPSCSEELGRTCRCDSQLSSVRCSRADFVTVGGCLPPTAQTLNLVRVKLPDTLSSTWLATASINDFGGSRQSSFRFLRSLRVEYSPNTKRLMPDAFEMAPQLESIHLTLMSISQIDEHSFQYCRRLREIALIDNNIRTVNPKAFHLVANTLVKLDLSKNKLTVFSLFDERSDTTMVFSRLVELNLAKNSLESINLSPDDPNLLGSTPKLRSLDLSKNRLKLITPMSRLSSTPIPMESVNIELNILDISENQLSFLSNETFGRLQRSLRTVDATTNPLMCDCKLRAFVKWLSAWKSVKGNVFAGWCSDLTIDARNHLRGLSELREEDVRECLTTTTTTTTAPALADENPEHATRPFTNDGVQFPWAGIDGVSKIRPVDSSMEDERVRNNQLRKDAGGNEFSRDAPMYAIAIGITLSIILLAFAIVLIVYICQRRRNDKSTLSASSVTNSSTNGGRRGDDSLSTSSEEVQSPNGGCNTTGKLRKAIFLAGVGAKKSYPTASLGRVEAGQKQFRNQHRSSSRHRQHSNDTTNNNNSNLNTVTERLMHHRNSPSDPQNASPTALPTDWSDMIDVMTGDPRLTNPAATIPMPIDMAEVTVDDGRHYYRHYGPGEPNYPTQSTLKPHGNGFTRTESIV